MKQTKIIRIPDIQSLKLILKNAGIDIKKWGIGQAKSIIDLLKEISDGETILIKTEDGTLLRKVNVVRVDILFQSNDGRLFRLREEKQVFKDGRERKRTLKQAVSEKMKADERPVEAAIRGIQEELGMTGEITLEEIATETSEIPSPSYPGLNSQYTVHKFQTHINAEQFNPNGYIEAQNNLTTYFTWEEVIQ